MKLTTLITILALPFTLKAELTNSDSKVISEFAQHLAAKEGKIKGVPEFLKETILRTDASPELIAALVEVAILQKPEDKAYIKKVMLYVLATAPDAYNAVKAVGGEYLSLDWTMISDKGEPEVAVKLPNPLDLIPLSRVPEPPRETYVTPTR